MLIPSSLTSLSWWPFAIVFICIIFIIIAIARFKMHAMIALLMAALLAGLLTGNSEWKIPDKNGEIKVYSGLVGVVELTSKGLGDTARDIAISVALASIIGMSLMQSGAADKVVRWFLSMFGQKNAGWALLWSTYVLSIPIFFDTMFMLMAPLAKALGRRTGKDYMLYAMCVACGGVITHSMTIPHPGPLVMVDVLQLDAGASLLAGLLGGIIPAFVGYYVAVWINKRLPIVPQTDSVGDDCGNEIDVPESQLPSLFWSLAPVLLPILLISLSSFAQIIQGGATKEPASGWCVAIYEMFGATNFATLRTYIDFIGNKNIALFIGAFLSLGVLMSQCKLSFAEIEKRVGPTLETAGMIILITSAGGAFGGMLRAIGVGDAVEQATSGGSLNLIFLSWIIASIVRIAQGSATVAMQTTVSLVGVGPMLATLDCHPLYLYLAIGWGAMGGSWMNDSGFWVVSRLGGFTQKETLQSWTVLLMFLSITGVLTTYIASRIMPLI